MPNLNSPGVDVSVIDESFYAGANRGTIPCILIATRENKTLSGGGIAQGTLKAKAGELFLAGSQRELNQWYGDAVFMEMTGTPLHGHELNEYGLHGAYSYLGLANQAYIIRGDIDLAQLDASAVAPRGAPRNGTFWLDINETRWGVFTNNGNSNPGLAWDKADIHVIDARSKAVSAYIGNRTTPIDSPSSATDRAGGTLISSAGVLAIDGYTISLTTADTLQTVLKKIRQAGIPDIKATMTAYAAVVPGSTSTYRGGLTYNLKVMNTRARNINFTGSTPQILVDLGLGSVTQVIEPADTVGVEGDFAVMTVANDLRVFQKMTPRDMFGVPYTLTVNEGTVTYTDVGPQWLWVGSDQINYTAPLGTMDPPVSAWNWTNATPTVVTSRAVTGPLPAGSFDIETAVGPQTITLTAGNTLQDIANQINNDPHLASSGIVADRSGVQLTISNVLGQDLEFSNDTANILGSILGIRVGTYRGNRLHYGTHAQVPSAAASAIGDVWIKTTSPNNGAKYAVKLYNSQVRQWRAVNVLMFADDTAAKATLGSALAVNTIYVRYNVAGGSTPTATHELRRWNGASWETLTAYEASYSEPSSDPVAGTLWYNNNLQVDILVSNGSQWYGYRNMYPGTDVILSASEPFQKPLGGGLIDYDLWIDTSDLENYPRIYRFSSMYGEWQLVDNTDQTTPLGIVFADARADDGAGSTDDIDLMSSNYVDQDVVDALSYPDGLLLWNTRLSTGNVKKWTPNHKSEGVLIGDRWVTVSGNKTDGSPYMLRKAQRIMVVRALAEAVAGNEDIRSEHIHFNLMAAPGYPELIDELVALNVDKKQHAFIVADAPARLKPNAADVQSWATNERLAASNGEEGLTTADMYVGVFYPWGLGVNSNGKEVMIPPSTMALRTFAYNDSVAYPWLAAAGFNRGMVTNATTVGYLTSEEEFKPVLLNQGQRDTLYLNNINPIAWIPNRGLVVYGQKTRYGQSSALDRINVARLTNYLRYHLELLAKPFLFEPNDLQTRDSARITFERFLADLVGLRALYDFVVVCDETNNTNERIDRNELWIDVGIQPVKAVEFIYIPIRVLNTGEDFGDQNLSTGF